MDRKEARKQAKELAKLLEKVYYRLLLTEPDEVIVRTEIGSGHRYCKIPKGATAKEIIPEIYFLIRDLAVDLKVR